MNMDLPFAFARPMFTSPGFHRVLSHVHLQRRCRAAGRGRPQKSAGILRRERCRYFTVAKRAIKAHSPAHLALLPADDFLAFDALRKASLDFVTEPPDLDPSCSTLSSWPSQSLVLITEIEEFTFVHLTGCEVVGLALEIYLYFVMSLL